MMRHSCLFRPVSGLLGSILIYMAVTCSVSSCTDDTFNKYQQENTGLLTFDVKVPGNWTNGLSRATTDISIKRMSQSAHAEPLYLVTEISEVAADAAASDAVAKEAATRGSMVNSTDNFHTNFGLSAICYTGAWPEEEPTDWGTDFAHNLKIEKKEEGIWKSAEKLNWLGSGGIRFFAYSPYSSSDNGIVHSDKNQGGIPTLTYTVPTDVTKQQDLMTAMEDCPGGQGGAVNLNFEHALTAVTIKTGTKMLSGEVTEITISGVCGKGTCQIGAKNWEPDKDHADCSFSIKEEIKLDENKDDLMTKPGIELNKDEEGYTFMMIPQTLTDKATLTIVFADSISKTPHILTAELQKYTKDKTWVAGKKYTYSVNTTGIIVEPIIEMKINRANTLYPNGGYKGIDVITLTEDNLYTKMTEADKLEYLPVSGFLNDVSIAAYTRVVQASATDDESKEQIRKLDFKIEWSTDEGKTWEPAPSGNSNMGWRPDAPSTQTVADETDGKYPSVNGSILLPAQPQFTYMQNFLYGEGTTIEQAKLPKTVEDPGEGTATDPYDLVNNNTVAKESANCYIVNNYGYYTFPAYYGNTYGKDGNTSSYIHEGDIPSNVEKLVLPNFVDHNDQKITKGSIDGVANAILLWQDSPDLVTDVKLNEKKNGWVSFRVPKETINQGNAVIAVRNSEGTILWSWHIWVTHRKWDDSSCITMSNENLNQHGRSFIITPCNLGYCEPHEGDPERKIYMRFVADPKLVNGSSNGNGVILNKQITIDGAPRLSSEKEAVAVITFTQPKITKSAAGDNTYYQWGRKDAMLPGVHNEDTYKNGLTGDRSALNEELDMVNKMFYSTEEFRFTSAETAQSIGKSIQLPHKFFIHKRPPTDDGKGVNGTPDDPVNNYKRRHWHDGTNTSYDLQTIMNYWNTQLVQSGNAHFVYNVTEKQNYKLPPNDQYVVKTIYDPSPAGFKIPPIKAFADFFDDVELELVPDPKPNNPDNKKTKGKPNADELHDKSSDFVGWKVDNINGRTFYFPATGVRDMGIKYKDIDYGTYPGFASITYIATSGFHDSGGTGSSCLILSIDKRNNDFFNHTKPVDGTNNAYGFTVRPIRDGQTGTGN